MNDCTVKILHIGEKFYFRRGWLKVVEALKLKRGQHLVFDYAGRDVFKLTAFKGDGMEYRLTPVKCPERVREIIDVDLESIENESDYNLDENNADFEHFMDVDVDVVDVDNCNNGDEEIVGGINEIHVEVDDGTNGDEENDDAVNVVDDDDLQFEKTIVDCLVIL
ncbi:uncharacterized protein LOC143604700 [Bidens hawaiensis]|uniref:uncharacterized protein LOC143604700 n=1 Tax=Bidens hawaiensis TaxID=980011 RepID=UPI004049C530